MCVVLIINSNGLKNDSRLPDNSSRPATAEGGAHAGLGGCGVAEAYIIIIIAVAVSGDGGGGGGVRDKQQYLA